MAKTTTTPLTAITQSQLAAWQQGDEAARNALIASIHAELGAISRMLMRGEQRRISIATDDLVNEALVKVLQSNSLKINDRAHLLALCASVMRHTLVDAARRRGRGKRGIAVTLATGQELIDEPDVDLLSLEHALLRLKAIDPGSAELVEMRYFGGMTMEDIAEVLDVSPSTVKRSWRAARAWLKGAIQNDF
ncbi:MAG: ECF-type sigma factor [Parvularculaceae bacterium]